MTVTIPAKQEHEGLYSMVVTISKKCPICGGERGNPYPTISYDGSRRLHVDGWQNNCGHLDRYSEVRKESRENIDLIK